MHMTEHNLYAAEFMQYAFHISKNVHHDTQASVAAEPRWIRVRSVPAVLLPACNEQCPKKLAGACLRGTQEFAGQQPDGV